MKKIITLVLTLTCYFSLAAQDVITEGVFTTKQTIKTDNEAVQAQLAMMGDMVSTTYFRDFMSRVELSNPMTGDVTVVFNSKTQEGLTLMNNPTLGKKFVLTSAKDPVPIMNNMKIEKGTNNRTILGYDCEEVILTYTENENELKMIFYTTDKISPILNQRTMQYGNEIGGFPMYSEATIYQGDIKMTIIAEVTEIKDEAINDSKLSLTPPEGYTEMNN